MLSTSVIYFIYDIIQNITTQLRSRLPVVLVKFKYMLIISKCMNVTILSMFRRNSMFQNDLVVSEILALYVPSCYLNNLMGHQVRTFKFLSKCLEYESN